MRTTRAILSVVILTITMFGASRLACADPCRRTLLQWSYGTSFEGGADLNEPLVTDRPDFTESSSTVGLGVVQVEMGYTYTRDDRIDGRKNEHSFPETLFRIGMLAEWFEFRLAWNWGESAENAFGVPFDTASGAEDLYLGSKLALTPQECMLPETALILQMTVPSGSDELTADEVLPGFNYIYGWEINDNWATAGSSQLNRAVDDTTGDAYVEFAQSWTVAQGWTDTIGSYTEWFVLVPSSADTNSTEHYFNGGFTYLFTDNVQWDVRAGVGLNDAADDYFVGSGLSVRMY